MRAVVFVPEEASEAKVGLLEQLGAELRRVGADLDESKELARGSTRRRTSCRSSRTAPSRRSTTATRRSASEILEQLGRPPGARDRSGRERRALIGVASGVGTVLGVVAKEAPVMALSVEAGHPVESRSLLRPLLTAWPSAWPFRIADRGAEPPPACPMTMVSEREIARAVGDYARAGIRAEGAAGSALAAFRELAPEHDPTVLIVTGRNIDDDLHRRAVEEPESFPD